jgi:imidazolonepropionase
MKASLIVYNIGTLLTPKNVGNPLKGPSMNDVIQLENAYIAIKDDKIIEVGIGDFERYKNHDTILFDADGKLVTPGLIDAHTHIVHAGSREYEFEKKMRGVPYLDILKEGGGIHSTVKATQQASEEALYQQAYKSLNTMLLNGVTTVEGKSGYGLEEATEIKQLTVQKKLNEDHPIDIVGTFMGAHAIPKLYEDKREAFIQLVKDMLPKVKKEGLAEFVDVFCEDGAFTKDESESLLKEAITQGFKVKIHADEIKALGGVKLACDLGATSADHLMAINEEGLVALSSSHTIATILPSTSFYLNSQYAPVREMINRNIAIALASDYNPGSSPSENFLFTLNLAAIHLKMSPFEILTAATINAAFAAGRESDRGIISKGYAADLVIYDAPNWPYVLYHFATNHVLHVFKAGKLVVKDKQLYKEETQ